MGLLDLLGRQECDARPQQGIDTQLGAIGTYWVKMERRGASANSKAACPKQAKGRRGSLPRKQKKRGGYAQNL